MTTHDDVMRNTKIMADAGFTDHQDCYRALIDQGNYLRRMALTAFITGLSLGIVIGIVAERIYG